MDSGLVGNVLQITFGSLLASLLGRPAIFILESLGIVGEAALQIIGIYPQIRTEKDPYRVALLDQYIIAYGHPKRLSLDGHSVGDGVYISIHEGFYTFKRETAVSFNNIAIIYTVYTLTENLIKKLNATIRKLMGVGAWPYDIVLAKLEGCLTTYYLGTHVDQDPINETDSKYAKQQETVENIAKMYNAGSGNYSFRFLICGNIGWGKSSVAKRLQRRLKNPDNEDEYPRLVYGFALTKKDLCLEMLRQSQHSKACPLIILIDEINVAMDASTSGKYSNCIAEDKASFNRFMDELEGGMRYTITIFTTQM
jgi:hypothetical protein